VFILCKISTCNLLLSNAYGTVTALTMTQPKI
jgi:hypothetical protein